MIKRLLPNFLFLILFTVTALVPATSFGDVTKGPREFRSPGTSKALGSNENGCSLDNPVPEFTQTLYKSNDFTNVISSTYVKSVEIDNDNDEAYSIEFKTDFITPYTGKYNEYFDTNGNVEFLINGVSSFKDVHGGTRRIVNFSHNYTEGEIVTITIRVSFVSAGPAYVHYYYNSDVNPTFFTPFNESPTPPAESDGIFFTPISDVSVDSGAMAKFSLNLFDSPAEQSNITWWRKRVGESSFSIVASGIDKVDLDYGPVTSLDNGALFKTTVVGRSCQLIKDTPTAKLTVRDKPSPTVLNCNASRSVAKIDQEVTFTGVGGDPTKYKWDSVSGVPPTCNGIRDPYAACDQYPLYHTHFISEGTKTVTLRQTGLADATCKITVVKDDPSQPLVCSADKSIVYEGDAVKLSVSGGSAPFDWTAPHGMPSIGTNQSFTTVFPTGHAGHTETITVRNGFNPDGQCKIEVQTKPPPDVLRCDPLEVEVKEGEPVTFIAKGGDPSQGYVWKGENATPDTKTGDTYTAEYTKPGHLPYNTVKLENGTNPPVYCKVTIAVPPPPPPTDPNKPQETTYYAYDRSPIAPEDCAQTSSKYPTKEIPSGECDPHPVNPYDIESFSEGLSRINHGIKITASSIFPENTVVDLFPEDPEKAGFNFYNSLFDANKEMNDANVTYVAQINAFHQANEQIDWLSNLIDFSTLGRKPDTLSISVVPKRLEFGLTDNKLIFCQYGWASSVVSLGTICSLESNDVKHEIGHLFAHVLNINTSRQYSNIFFQEYGGLNEGLADYFALANQTEAQQQYLIEYACKKAGCDPQRGLSIGSDESKYVTFLPWINHEKMDPRLEIHEIGARVAYRLLVFRNIIAKSNYADKENLLTSFDTAVAMGYATLPAPIFAQSATQELYIGIYRYINSLVRAGRFPAELRELFKRHIYEYGIGLVYGTPFDIPSSRYSLSCTNKDQPDKIQYSYYVDPHYLNAVDEKIQYFKIIFTDTVTGEKQVNTFDATTKVPLIQKGLNIPLQYPNQPSLGSLIVNMEHDFSVDFEIAAGNYTRTIRYDNSVALSSCSPR